MPMYPLTLPRVSQPQRRVPYSSCGYGKHLIWDILPSANNFYSRDGINDMGVVLTGGRPGTGNSGQAFFVDSYAFSTKHTAVRSTLFPYMGLGRLNAAHFEGNGYRLLRSNPADQGIQWPRDHNICVVTIFKPTGNGQVGYSDPRIYSEDIGYNESDHQFMVGTTSTSEVRSRIRLNGTTRTVYAGSGQLENDAVNVIVAGVIPDGANFRTYTAHISETKGWAYGESATSGAGFTRISGVSQAIASNAEQINGFAGQVLGVWALDTAIVTEAALRAFVRQVSDWSLYEGDTIVLPVAAAAGGYPYHIHKRTNNFRSLLAQ